MIAVPQPYGKTQDLNAGEVLKIVLIVVLGIYMALHIFFLPAEIISIVFSLDPSFNALFIYFILVMAIKYTGIVFMWLSAFSTVTKLKSNKMIYLIVLGVNGLVSIINIVLVLIGVLKAKEKISNWILHPYTIDFFLMLICCGIAYAHYVFAIKDSKTIYYYMAPTQQKEEEETELKQMETTNEPLSTEKIEPKVQYLPYYIQFQR